MPGAALRGETGSPPSAIYALVGALVRDHALDLWHVGLVKHHVGVELALALGSLRSQDVAFVRVSALDLARTCLVEALGRSAMSFQLRHSVLYYNINAPTPPAIDPSPPFGFAQGKLRHSAVSPTKTTPVTVSERPAWPRVEGPLFHEYV